MVYRHALTISSGLVLSMAAIAQVQVGSLQQTKLLASDGAAGDSFGSSVCVWGETALVGAIYDGGSMTFTEGATYVFVHSGANWVEQAKLTSSDATDRFGSAVSLQGDTALVGASYDDSSGTDAGAAYVFARSGTAWTEVTKLTTSDGDFNDLFGSSASLDGDTALVGAPRDDNSPFSGSGSAYVFVRSGAQWIEQAKLIPSDGQFEDLFGGAVSLQGDTALVGADEADAVSGEDSGSVYVFVRDGGEWTEVAKLTASDAAADGHFGCSVSLLGDTALVGAYGDAVNGFDSGSAYVFERSGTAWTEVAKLTAADGEQGDRFGTFVSLSGNKALMGAPGDDGNGNGPNSGSAYVFERSGTSWSEVAKLAASDGESLDDFGGSVSLDGDTMLVGASQDDFNGPYSGSAYLFEPAGSLGSWCSPGMSTSGCQVQLTASGAPSATAPSGFVVTAGEVEGSKNGLYFFGTNGSQVKSWGTSTSVLCVVPPTVRGPLMTGTGTNGLCDGTFALDLNALWCATCSAPQKNPGPGAAVDLQLWYRDPLSTSNKPSALSNSIEFTVE